MYRIVFLIVVFFIFHACSKKESNEVIENLSFNVDSSLIAEKIIDTEMEISFHSPKNWERLPDTVINSVFKKFVQFEDSINEKTGNLRLKFCFFQSDDTCLFLISKVMDNNIEALTKKMSEYSDYYSKKDSSSIAKTTKFTTKGFTVTQLMAVDIKNILFKMIFIHPEIIFPFQLDFLTPKNSYEKYIRTIESLSGSMSKTN